jgi:guanine deaminase
LFDETKSAHCSQYDKGLKMAFYAQTKFMRLALTAAAQNLRSGEGGPFGACIVKDDEVLAVAANSVLREDATCHAEINAIRAASRKLGGHDLSGCVIYSTTEPCPMCFSAIHWAGIQRIVYGTRIKDVQKLGFRELPISNRRMKRQGHSTVKLSPGFLRKECKKLLKHWRECPHCHTY